MLYGVGGLLYVLPCGMVFSSRGSEHWIWKSGENDIFKMRCKARNELHSSRVSLEADAAEVMDPREAYTSERPGATTQGAQWIFGTNKFTEEDHARIQEVCVICGVAHELYYCYTFRCTVFDRIKYG